MAVNTAQNKDWQQQCEAVSGVIRALSHEHRLMILSLVYAKERSVSELEDLLSLPQPAVSQQLARLRLDDLVEARRDGRTIYYRANIIRITDLLSELGHLFKSASMGQSAGDSSDNSGSDLQLSAGIS